MSFSEKIKSYSIYLLAYLLSVFLVGHFIGLFFFQSGGAYLFIGLAVIPIGMNFKIPHQNMAVSIPAALCTLFVAVVSFHNGAYNRYPQYADYIGLCACALCSFLFMRMIYSKGRNFKLFPSKSILKKLDS